MAIMASSTKIVLSPLFTLSHPRDGSQLLGRSNVLLTSLPLPPLGFRLAAAAGETLRSRTHDSWRQIVEEGAVVVEGMLSGGGGHRVLSGPRVARVEALCLPV